MTYRIGLRTRSLFFPNAGIFVVTIRDQKQADQLAQAFATIKGILPMLSPQSVQFADALVFEKRD